MSCAARIVDGGIDLRRGPFIPGEDFRRHADAGFVVRYRTEFERNCLQQTLLRFGRRLALKIHTRSDSGVMKVSLHVPPTERPMSERFLEGGFTERDLLGVRDVRVLRRHVRIAIAETEAAG
jgi:hypothetical protein